MLTPWRALLGASGTNLTFLSMSREQIWTKTIFQMSTFLKWMKDYEKKLCLSIFVWFNMFGNDYLNLWFEFLSKWKDIILYYFALIVDKAVSSFIYFDEGNPHSSPVVWPHLLAFKIFCNSRSWRKNTQTYAWVFACLIDLFLISSHISCRP